MHEVGASIARLRDLGLVEVIEPPRGRYGKGRFRLVLPDGVEGLSHDEQVAAWIEHGERVLDARDAESAP